MFKAFYDTAKWQPIQNKLRIAIIDTGVSPHKDLKITGGKNLVRGENDAEYTNDTVGNGTLICGIIGASGGIHGVAKGMAARILSTKPEILRLERNQVRADEMVKYLAICTKLMGFGSTFEGKGMLDGLFFL